MSNQIKVSKTVFFSYTTRLTSGNTSLKSVDAKFYGYNSTSTVLDLYKQQFEDLSNLINSYATFLDSDIKLMNNTVEEIVNLDSKIGKTYTSNESR